MLVYSFRRLAHALVTISVAFVLVFVAVRFTPGGPALAMLGQRATPESIARVNRELGWDQSIPLQLWRYFRGLVRGDLGIAYLSPGRPKVTTELARRFPATVELGLAAMSLALVIGLPLGILAAAYRRRWPDRAAIAVSSLGVSVPVFFLGIVLLMLFPQMPGSGRMDIRANQGAIERTGLLALDAVLAGRWDYLVMVMRHLALPALALSSIPLAIIARVTRSSLLEVLGADYIRTARSKGVGTIRLFIHHAFRAALVPILSLLGMQLATLMAGAVLTESVFSWPGIGRYVTEAATRKDYNALQGSVLLLGMVFVLLNFLTDLACAYFDPRIRLGEGDTP